jgi:retinol dehydrogenase 12
VGKELAQILYSRNAKVYLAARSSEKVAKVIIQIKSKFPDSQGQLAFLRLNLEDLSTIKSSAEEFLSKEERLDILWNNAGIMAPPQGSVSEQGYELMLGTNALGPFLFTQLLTPILAQTAKPSPPGSVRVVWVSSSAAELGSPIGGVDMGNLDYKMDKNTHYKYAVSKAGVILYCKQYAKLYKDNGIISVVSLPLSANEQY